MSPLLGLSGFGGGVSRFGGLVGEPSDEYFNYVAMLLHGDGTNGAQNNTFLDSSSNNFTITRNGNATQGTFSPFGDRWSNHFDGSGDYLTNSSSSFISNTVSTFTVEGWVFLNANPSSSIDISGFVTLDGTNSTSNYMSFGPINDRTLRLRWFDGAGKSASGSTAIPLSTWTHIACVVNSNSIQFYVNGVAESMGGTTTLTNRNGTNNTSLIGANGYGAINGYISNVRVTNTAVYTSGFTPSTEPLTAISGTRVLACQSNRFKDNSTNNYTLAPTGNVSVQRFSPFLPTEVYDSDVVGGSGYFDGSSDYLSITSNTAFAAPSNFTFECWAYPTSSVSSQCIYLVNATNGLIIYTVSNKVVVRVFGVADILTSSINLPLNQWVHIAAVRSGTTLSLFINGSRSNGGTVTNSTSFAQGALLIGTNENNVLPYYGYISNLRFVKGTAVYDPTQSSITVPTAPLTNITNTSLLLSGTNAGIIDNATTTNLETVGNAQVSTSVKKFGTGSMSFDGTGDYLKIPNNPGFNLGSGNFTIECWVNFSANQDSTIIARIDNSATGDWSFFYNSSVDKWRIVGTSQTIQMSNTWVPTTGVWYHVSVTRSGNDFRFFIDGVQQGTTQTNSVTFSFDTNSTYVGTLRDATLPLNGYIDDLRITKGIARYTTTFTPPTKAFPNK